MKRPFNVVERDELETLQVKLQPENGQKPSKNGRMCRSCPLSPLIPAELDMGLIVLNNEPGTLSLLMMNSILAGLCLFL